MIMPQEFGVEVLLLRHIDEECIQAQPPPEDGRIVENAPTVQLIADLEWGLFDQEVCEACILKLHLCKALVPLHQIKALFNPAVHILAYIAKHAHLAKPSFEQ